ncbi:Polyketide cyclase/dehydrase and lipid transport superfamily protein [Heracleum sosnowskyi]|uniref:Polyketide cyclase/dehydrase and lipid transport superfamily protein n=1 Tax=Heracleum sosnowskyi TaxID=360622 RepID=A0AAD8J1T0_9APIA|nr:Polyketide cyclase/dehydrase and lipid transport superfamily protein [Heracleum sosnowskyi]
MEDCLEDVINFLKKPEIIETFVDILICSVPLWVAAVIGLVIGWSWRPRWTSIVYLGLRPKLSLIWTFPLGFGARRLWIDFTALSAFSLASRLWSNFRVRNRKDSDNGLSARYGETTGGNIRMATGAPSKENIVVNENDFEHLLHLINSLSIL